MGIGVLIIDMAFGFVKELRMEAHTHTYTYDTSGSSGYIRH
jgi:hypothetical protein